MAKGFSATDEVTTIFTELADADAATIKGSEIWRRVAFGTHRKCGRPYFSAVAVKSPSTPYGSTYTVPANFPSITFSLAVYFTVIGLPS